MRKYHAAKQLDALQQQQSARRALYTKHGERNVFFRKRHERPPSEEAARVQFAKRLYGELNRRELVVGGGDSHPRERALRKSPTKPRIAPTGQHLQESSSPLEVLARANFGISRPGTEPERAAAQKQGVH